MSTELIQHRTQQKNNRIDKHYSPVLPKARWPWERSLQFRIVLVYALMFALILSLLTWRMAQVLATSQLEEAENGLEVEAFLTTNALEDALSGFTQEFDNHGRYLNATIRDNQQLIGTWTVGNQTFLVDEHTEFEEEEGSFVVGGCAEIHLRQTENGPTAVKVESNSCNNDESNGEITSFPESERLLILETSAQRQAAPEMPRLQRFVTSYAQDTSTRVTVMDKWGNVIADSQHSRDVVTNQYEQIEVQAALQDNEQHHVRTDPLTGAETLFVAAPINQSGRELGIVRLSQPMSILTSRSRAHILGLVLASFVALLVTVIIGTMISLRLVQPVQRLERAAIQIAQGDLAHHVPVDRADELGALAGAFNHMVGELSRTFDQQRLFIASASHELRTPLTNIKLRSDALLRNSEDQELLQLYLVAISSETERLGRLAADLLNLAKLESQTNRASRAEQQQPVEIRSSLESAYALMELRAQSSDILLRSEIPEDLPKLSVNPVQFETIIMNLLDNAINYTPAGGVVELEAKVVSQSNANAQATGQCLRIHVNDTGVGIPAEDLQHIFDPFYRVDKARSRRHNGLQASGSGTGLGLTITNTLVYDNGGRISVESTLGKGTLFVIEFDLGK